MARLALQYSLREVDDAGDVLASKSAAAQDLEHAFTVVNNWRACHAFPLNTFQVTLQRKARAIDANVLVAQRTKRLPAIVHKLERFKKLRLSEFQDIGGCRAVLSDIRGVRSLREDYRGSNLRHTLLSENDYVTTPKKSGYRSLHLVFGYLSDRTVEHNGRKIEMQIRSRLQHAWATSVETVGMFSGEYLKSSMGDKRWLRFFALMGSAIAIRESSAIVPGTPEERKDLFGELRSIAAELDAKKKLMAYGQALRFVEPEKGSYFLLKLNAQTEQLEIKGFARQQFAKANAEYVALERTILDSSGTNPSMEAVLVSVDSVKLLRQAYPNYYLDTQLFVQALETATRNHAGGS